MRVDENTGIELRREGIDPAALRAPAEPPLPRLLARFIAIARRRR